MPLDPRQPVIVKKTIVTEGSNVYPARERPYPPGSIPADFLNDEYCTQKGVTFQSLPDASPTIDQTQSPITTQGLSQGQMVEEKEPEPEKLNINFASPDKIASFLKGVGPKTVEALDACRQEKPFESIADLDERCPLPKASGKTWEHFEDVISF